MTEPVNVPNLPEPPPEEYPRRFGAYTLLAPLARGGMGEVFLAKTGGVAGFEKRCVVKTLRPHLTDDREYVARFVDEARVVVQLGHRNICQVFDVGTVGERYYLAMEYIAGRDAKSLQSRAPGERLEPGIAIHVVCEVLEALDYAHRHVDAATGKPLELVHRDISPQNVMVSFEGEVKLIDFGLAASAVKHEQTQPNVVMGKLAYMAPEQVRGDKVDGRVDLFAVGVVLYELLVGERFYEGRSPYEIWGIAAQGGFRPRQWETLPPGLRDVLDRALAGAPAQRYATGLEMRAALDAYRFDHGLRGDAPALRALMQQLFQPEIEENQRLLQLLATTKSGDSGPLPMSTAHEPTISIARAISAPQVHKDKTEPTGALVAPRPAPSRAPRAAALIGGVVVAAALAALVPSLLRPPPLGPRDVVRTADAGAAVAAIADAGHAPVAVTPPDAGVVDVAAAAPDAGLDARDARRLDPTDRRTLRKTRQIDRLTKRLERVRDGDATPADPPADPPPADTPADPPAADPQPAQAAPRYRDLPKGRRVEVLKQRCTAPCVAAVAKAYAEDNWASDALRDSFTRDLRACWVDACGLPE